MLCDPLGGRDPQVGNHYCTVRLHCGMERSRQDKTAAEKLELLNLHKMLPAVCQRQAAQTLGISSRFLQNFLKNETAIQAEGQNCQTAKHNRVGKDEEVENALFAWFKFVRNNNAPVDEPILMQKAKAIAQPAEHDDFKATDGCSFFVGSMNTI